MADCCHCVVLWLSRLSSSMREPVPCCGSSHSELRETRTSTSVWHATARERCPSRPSWPLSEVEHTHSHTIHSRAHPVFILYPLDRHFPLYVHTPGLSRRLGFPAPSAVDVTTTPCHTLPFTAGCCSFYSPLFSAAEHNLAAQDRKGGPSVLATGCFTGEKVVVVVFFFFPPSVVL